MLANETEIQTATCEMLESSKHIRSGLAGALGRLGGGSLLDVAGGLLLQLNLLVELLRVVIVAVEVLMLDVLSLGRAGRGALASSRGGLLWGRL